MKVIICLLFTKCEENNCNSNIAQKMYSDTRSWCQIANSQFTTISRSMAFEKH